MPNTEIVIISPVIGPKAGSNRAADIGLALLLTYITLVWMTIEGGASLILGVID